MNIQENSFSISHLLKHIIIIQFWLSLLFLKKNIETKYMNIKELISS